MVNETARHCDLYVAVDDAVHASVDAHDDAVLELCALEKVN